MTATIPPRPPWFRAWVAGKLIFDGPSPGLEEALRIGREADRYELLYAFTTSKGGIPGGGSRTKAIVNCDDLNGGLRP